MLFGSFTDTGTSQPFFVLKRCSLRLTPMTGTNVIAVQVKIAGTWETVRVLTAAFDDELVFGDVAHVRLNCTMHDTADIDYFITGQFLADEITTLTGQHSLLLKDDDDLLLKNNEYLALEA